jgi:UDP-2,4-diacetamido-2,4,6-trideoxy-beta-L-altropyranose hydrolase
VPDPAGALIAVRTTASKQIGFGHLRRCLTLAGELRAGIHAHAGIEFWIQGDLAALAVAEADGFPARQVAGPEPATTAALVRATGIGTLIVDAYDVDEASFSALRPLLRHGLVALDDLADRFLDVDMIINGSPHAAKLRYRSAPDALRLLGPEYALLRPIFRELAVHSSGAAVTRVLVTMGGADPHGATALVVAAVRRALPGAKVDLVIGPLFGPVPDLEDLALREPSSVHLHRAPGDLAPLMADADIAVSGGGQTLYELAAAGVPTVAVCVADNQQGNIAALRDVSLLPGGTFPEAAISGCREVEAACRRLAADRNLRERMSGAGRALVDAMGGARVADMILRLMRTKGAVDHVRLES